MDTIAAIATPFGSAGIGIIRLSGDQVQAILRRLFRTAIPVTGPSTSSECRSFRLLDSHHLTHGYICDPSSGQVVDEVLAVYMAAPHSYTREDVVEIQSHSGYLLLQRILSLVLDSGARLAEPGEFTRRAFLNGRIDLSQAEAIIDMIQARSDGGLRQAANQLQGGMRKQIEDLIKRLTDVCVQLQGNIEFPDESDAPDTPRGLSVALRKELLKPIDRLLDNFQSAHVLRDGIRLAIVGRPNVGKSSILNRLLESSKAIVSPFPGTTRDPVEGFLQVRGIPLVFADTAGLHTSGDPIEKIGMQKTKECIDQSDFVFFVLAADEHESVEDQLIFQQVQHKPVLVVINKMDLVTHSPVLQASLFAQLPSVMVSATTGEGFSLLKDTMATLCVPASLRGDHECVPTLRQKNALDQARAALVRAAQAIADQVPDDLVLSDLETANAQLNAIVGADYSIDLLDEIFSRFCIGK